MEEEFCDLLRTVDSTGRGSLCYNGECWAVSLVHPYKPILETLKVTHRYLRREGLPHLPIDSYVTTYKALGEGHGCGRRGVRVGEGGADCDFLIFWWGLLRNR